VNQALSWAVKLSRVHHKYYDSRGHRGKGLLRNCMRPQIVHMRRVASCMLVVLANSVTLVGHTPAVQKLGGALEGLPLDSPSLRGGRQADPGNA